MDEDGYFGETVAERYDEDDAEMFAADVLDPMVDVLAGLAGEGGRALEFAIGTGRVAMPLAARGVEVHGIDMSQAMVRQLRAKPGGADLSVTIGDFSTTRVEGTFSLVYLVYNTIGNLTTQDAQVACFANAAAHLAPGGHFLIETGIPALRRLPPGQTAVPFHVDETSWGFDTYDVATQAMASHHIKLVGDEAHHTYVPFRYVWPSELDLMARLAGMHPKSRWSTWQASPFTAESTKHISVWQKPTT